MRVVLKCNFVALFAVVLALPFAAMLLQLHALDNDLDRHANWLAFEFPKMFARAPDMLHPVFGVIAALVSSGAFWHAWAKTVATFLMFLAYSFSQSMAFLMPARLLPPDVCAKCGLLDPSVGEVDISTVFGATALVVSLWFFFIGLPLGIVVAGFHLFFIRFAEAFKGHR